MIAAFQRKYKLSYDRSAAVMHLIERLHCAIQVFYAPEIDILFNTLLYVLLGMAEC